jgi:outer membrane protein
MSYQLKTTIKFAAVALVAAFSSASFAQSAGDNVVSVGWFHIAPENNSTPIDITSPAMIAGPVAGTGANVAHADTLGFSINHFYTNNWVVSLDLGVPPTYKLSGAGTLAAVGQIGTAKQWAPAVVGKYYFFESNAVFRPFLGLGVSHVSYSGIDLNQTAFNEIFSKVGATSTEAKLSSSWSPVFNVGATYALDKNWSLGFSVSYLGLKTTADLTTQSAIGPVTSSTSLKLDPIVTYATVNYRF